MRIAHSPYAKNTKPQNGFTLIELMVVMVIVALLMGMVGPLAINSLEKAEAKQEMLSLKNWFRKVSARAFNTGQVHVVQLSGKQIVLYSKPITHIENTSSVDTQTLHSIELNEQPNNTLLTHLTLLEQFNFQSLFFQPQTLVYNAKGYVYPTNIEGTYRGNPLRLNLKEWVNGESELEEGVHLNNSDEERQYIEQKGNE